jgi:hypothetical protein
MNKRIGTLAAVFLLSTAAFADVTKEDLKKLAAAKISDSVVVAYVRAYGPMPRMSAQDLIELKSAGLSDKVLEQIAAEGPKPAPAPARTEAVERRVHVVLPPAVVCPPHAWHVPCRPWGRIGFCW